MTMEEKVDELSKDVNEIKISIAQLPAKIIKEASSMFASKLTEKVVYALLAVSFMAAIGFWVNFINQKNTLTSSQVEAIVKQVVEKDYIEK